jgi:hypothetical protein
MAHQGDRQLVEGLDIYQSELIPAAQARAGACDMVFTRLADL